MHHTVAYMKSVWVQVLLSLYAASLVVTNLALSAKYSRLFLLCCIIPDLSLDLLNQMQILEEPISSSFHILDHTEEEVVAIHWMLLSVYWSS